MKIAPVRIAIVGSGAMGALHARVVSQSMDADLACVIDPDREAGEALAERWRSQWFPELDSFRGIDALIIASPTGSHVEWAKRAIDEGKPVLVEKPIAEDLAEVDGLLDLARERGIPLTCGLLERFNSAILTAVRDRRRALSRGHRSPLALPSAHRERRGLRPVDPRRRLHAAPRGRDAERRDRALLVRAPVFAAGLRRRDRGEPPVRRHAGVASASRISQRKLRSLVIYELERMIEVDLVRQDITVYRHVGADFLEDGGHGYRQQTVMDIPVVQNARGAARVAARALRRAGVGRGDADRGARFTARAARGGREDRGSRPGVGSRSAD